tara:strand:+ start:72 stop:770 length:699 start_codon:yes stop_codon:yes gene_type:complete
MYDDLKNSNGEPNSFEQLESIDLTKYIQKKGRFPYVSWADAVAIMSKRHPDITWTITKFTTRNETFVNDNLVQTERTLPYMMDSQGNAFVEIKTTVNDKELEIIHPVLSNTNKPIKFPSSWDINTAIQRGLVKTFALHGLGLYIYRGEDLPECRIDGSIYIDGEATIEQYIKLDKLIRSRMFTNKETEEFRMKYWNISNYPSEVMMASIIKQIEITVKERKSNANGTNGSKK